MNKAQAETGLLASGWYLVEGWGFQPSSRIHAVVEPASAQEPPEHVPLRGVDASGKLQSTVVLPQDARRVWLSSDGRGSRPESGEWTFRRVNRFEAIIRMLCGLKTEEGAIAWSQTGRILHDALAVGMTMGVGRAAGVVVSRYLFSLRDGQERKYNATRARLRFGAWPIAMSAQLQPIKHLRSVPDAETAGTWEATGEDPCFRVADCGLAVPLSAGWYRLRIRVQLESGSIVAPALYPDYGKGYAHEEMVRLPDPGRNGEIDSLILLKNDVKTLRFDPTLRRARFRVDWFDLARVGRASALLRMLVGLHGSNGGSGWKATASAVAGFARTAVTHGLSPAVSDLYAAQPSSHASGGSYADWVRRYDTIGKLELDGLRQRARSLEDGPLISVILPVYQTPERWLRRCLDSVIGQVYGNWELCVVDDASPNPDVRALLEGYAAREPRIRVCIRTTNGHISEASNSALAMARGGFVGLLDHDDELRPHALLEVVEAMMRDPALAMVYSDEDKIDADGRRFDPYFKPDWNPDLLLSQNYVCHFTVLRTELVRAVGGFRRTFEGSQDHDLILRCAERLEPRNIHHIPRVLYHWRAIEGSTALHRDSKDYASAAGARAVQDHLERIGQAGLVEELPHGHYRVHWPVPRPAPKVSILIPTRDKVDLLRTCIDSLKAITAYPNFEILVVDNQSAEPETLAYLRSIDGQAGIRVLAYDAPFNYSAMNNYAAARSDGELLCLLNNDIEVIEPDWLTEMVGQASRPEVGAVGALLYYPDLSIQHAGVILGVGGVANHAYMNRPADFPGHGGRARVVQDLSAVTGACMVLRRAVFKEVGGFDDALAVAFNDVDLCLRIRAAGYRILWTPFARLVHHESATRGADDSPEKRSRFISEVERMQNRWGEALLNDPAYNPNLSLDSTDFELAFPPR